MDAVARLLVWLGLITSNRSNRGQTRVADVPDSKRKSAACCQGEGREESEDARGEEGDLLAVCGWRSWWSAMMCENQSAKGPGT